MPVEQFMFQSDLVRAGFISNRSLQRKPYLHTGDISKDVYAFSEESKNKTETLSFYDSNWEDLLGS